VFDGRHAGPSGFAPALESVRRPGQLDYGAIGALRAQRPISSPRGAGDAGQTPTGMGSNRLSGCLCAAKAAAYRAWDEKYGAGKQPMSSIVRLTSCRQKLPDLCRRCSRRSPQLPTESEPQPLRLIPQPDPNPSKLPLTSGPHPRPTPPTECDFPRAAATRAHRPNPHPQRPFARARAGHEIAVFAALLCPFVN
jgi:hypothetical protein